MKIVKKEESGGSHYFDFDNGAWVGINLEEELYEFQSDQDDEETYFSGWLDFSEDGSTLEGYDGCHELPEEVVEACRALGKDVSEFVSKRRFRVKVRLAFDGYVLVHADSREKAEKTVSERFHGRLDCCGDTTDESFVEWDVDQCSSETVIIPFGKR
ncbi:MAG: hypothetical protein IJM04_04490 [Prevotella sp.]|nr:hypothetical protein [Prevotella sp.]